MSDVDVLLDAVTDYLQRSGINPAVVGPVTIQHQPSERQHNHELVVRFTAVLPDYLPDNAPEVAYQPTDEDVAWARRQSRDPARGLGL